MRTWFFGFAILAATLVSIPAQAQLPQLPALSGYPILEGRPYGMYLPTVWTDGSDSLMGFHGGFPGGMHVFQESAGADIFVSGGGWYAPDVFGSFVVGEYWHGQPLPSMAEVISFDVFSGAQFHLSGPGTPLFRSSRRPSIGEKYAAWVTFAPLGMHAIGFNMVDGDPFTAGSVNFGDEWRYDWPSVWENFIVFEAAIADSSNDILAQGIAAYDIDSGVSYELMDSFVDGQPYRYAPHISDGRVVYHFRDAPNSSATFSTIMYTDLDSWGSEIEPSFLKHVECQKYSAPRVGGEKGRFILFTGVECQNFEEFPAVLLLGDTWTDNLYFVDWIEHEPDTYDHRPFYDIHENWIVYKFRHGDFNPGYDFALIYAFDESAM